MKKQKNIIKILSAIFSCFVFSSHIMSIGNTHNDNLIIRGDKTTQETSKDIKNYFISVTSFVLSICSINFISRLFNIDKNFGNKLLLLIKNEKIKKLNKTFSDFNNFLSSLKQNELQVEFDDFLKKFIKIQGVLISLNDRNDLEETEFVSVFKKFNCILEKFDETFSVLCSNSECPIEKKKICDTDLHKKIKSFFISINRILDEFIDSKNVSIEYINNELNVLDKMLIKLLAHVNASKYISQKFGRGKIETDHKKVEQLLNEEENKNPKKYLEMDDVFYSCNSDEEENLF
ncbi:MAG: hypothetical protein FWC41_01720, partial [Firmicutes bacterium]|nr:hypothetical protein [Bacillota bacterium]